MQETLFAEMKGRIKEDDSSAPDPDGPYAYYVRYRKEGQHPLLCREARNSPHFPSTHAADVKPENKPEPKAEAADRKAPPPPKGGTPLRPDPMPTGSVRERR